MRLWPASELDAPIAGCRLGSVFRVQDVGA